MYAISKNKRKYSPTPIVKIIIDANGKETEELVLMSCLKKKVGDELLATIVLVLNEQEVREAITPKCINIEDAFQDAMNDGYFLAAMRIHKISTNCSLIEARDYVNSIRSQYENKS
jgi:hypothetical protein